MSAVKKYYPDEELKTYYPDEPAPGYFPDEIPDAYEPEYKSYNQNAISESSYDAPVAGIISASSHLQLVVSKGYISMSHSAQKEAVPLHVYEVPKPFKPRLVPLTNTAELQAAENERLQQSILREYIDANTYTPDKMVKDWDAVAGEFEDVCLVLKHRGGQSAISKVSPRMRTLSQLIGDLLYPKRAKKPAETSQQCLSIE